jgi:CHAT domain-containing protein
MLAASAAAPPAELAPLLPVLLGADNEARAVAAAYPQAELLTGPRVTPSEFLALARRSTVVHFAGHAVTSASDPAKSFLVMAADEDGKSVLYASDIDRERWPVTNLVMLSACHTASTPRRDAEGVQGLARAFLSAGVPAVVATLWEIDDHLAEEVAVAFHRAHASGLDPASALRVAQLALLAKDPDAPPRWAALEMIGGVRELTIH